MKYTDAKAFVALLAPMDVVIAEHIVRCQQLARTIEEKKQHIVVPLLGVQVVSNLLAAITVAHTLGMPLAEIANASVHEFEI